MSRSPTKALLLLAVLVAALGLRWSIFSFPLLEHDETIYKALVEQVRDGHGHTLRGHPLLDKGWIEKRMYDSPVFFHPPVGIWLFTASALAIGGDLDVALKATQLLCFAGYYVLMLASLALLLPEASLPVCFAFSVLLALNPVAAHVGTKVWLENPRLLFFALSLWTTLRFARRPGPGTFVGAAVAAFALELTKIDGVLVLPFVHLFGCAAAPGGARRYARFMVPLVAAELAVAGAWIFYSEALRYGPGRPTEALIAANSFVRHVTVDTSPAQFLENFFKLCFALVPAVAVAAWKKPGVARGTLLALGASQCAFYVGLSALGYSKMARYLVMAVPAAAILFAFACHDVEKTLRAGGPRRREAFGFLVVLVLCGALEAWQGYETLLHHARDALVEPFF